MDYIILATEADAYLLTESDVEIAASEIFVPLVTADVGGKKKRRKERSFEQESVSVKRPDRPEAPEGKEVIWVAPQWIVRDPAPANREGYQWAYFLNEGWVELPLHETAHDASVVTDNTSVVTDTFISLTSSQLG